MGYSGAMMPEALPAPTARRLIAAALVSFVLAGCASGAAREDDRPMVESATDASARLMVAEAALERGDCRAAAAEYLKIALGSDDARLAARASQVAIACAQLAPAQRATARWRELEPESAEAALAAGIVALQLYKLDDARTAFTVWRDAGAAGNQDPGQFAELLARETDATAAYRIFSEVLAGSDPTAEVLLAQARLAQQSYDLKAAVELAERALAIDARMTDARLLAIRSRAMLGEVDAAVAAAREIQDQLAGDDVFIVADILEAADRPEEARRELERLRETPALAAPANRRLAAQALARGDLDAAEAQFTALMGDRGSTAIALLYLAQIAERKGDVDAALERYQLLANSAIGLTARASAARLLLGKGQRQQAMALLDEYARANPEEAVEVAAARGQILAGEGMYDVALADLDASLERYPGHPTIEYQRATVLERAGRKRQSESAFKSLARKRPEDPGIANALGFTLADHGRELALAEKLIAQALQVSPDSPAIQDSHGWVLFRRGRAREALPVLERAFANLRDPEIGAHFGEVLWSLGDQGRAHYVWQQALSVDPENAVLRNTIARLTGEEPPPARP